MWRLCSTVFAHRYKLVTLDMGPASRCVNADAPPAQPYQFPLPDPPSTLANFTLVKADIRAALFTKSDALTPDYTPGGKPYYGALYATLAWRCAATYRDTDHFGGCNGARIRLYPQGSWPINFYLDKVGIIVA